MHVIEKCETYDNKVCQVAKYSAAENFYGNSKTILVFSGPLWYFSNMKTLVSLIAKFAWL